MTIAEFEKCSNCGACYNICSQKAISVETNHTFFTPIVNEELCINCGKCVEVCPVNSDFKKNMPIYACAGWHNDKSVLLSSSSGGLFHGIAEMVISAGGVVFSAVYSDDYKKVYFTSSDEVELSRFKKSKYVESIIDDIFIKIEEELKKERVTLFCATPCQIAGLKNFLGKDYDNLITCDFACGGLPSHKIYQDYLSELEIKYKSKITHVDFRPKTHGWKRYAVLIKFENGKTYNRLGVEDPYLKSFLYGKYTVRDYCLECEFSEQHASDITIADFWLHQKLSDLTNNNGISLVLCNNNKGKKIIEKIEDNYSFEDLNVLDASYNNIETITDCQAKERHDLFINLYEEYGFEYAYKKLLPSSLVDKIKNSIRRIISKQ